MVASLSFSRDFINQSSEREISANESLDIPALGFIIELISKPSFSAVPCRCRHARTCAARVGGGCLTGLWTFRRVTGTRGMIGGTMNAFPTQRRNNSTKILEDVHHRDTEAQRNFNILDLLYMQFIMTKYKGIFWESSGAFLYFSLCLCASVVSCFVRL